MATHEKKKIPWLFNNGLGNTTVGCKTCENFCFLICSSSETIEEKQKKKSSKSCKMIEDGWEKKINRSKQNKNE